MDGTGKRYEILQNLEFTEPTTSSQRYELIRQPVLRPLPQCPPLTGANNCNNGIVDPSTLSLSNCHEIPVPNGQTVTKVRKGLGYSVYAENFNRLLQRGVGTSRRKPSVMKGSDREVIYYRTESNGRNTVEIEQGNAVRYELNDKQFRPEPVQLQASSVKPASFGNSNANISKPVLNQQNKCVSKHSDIFNDPNRFKTKPAISYATLVALALKNSKNGCLTVQEVYDFVDSNFPFFRTANSGWKNSVRHNLSFSKYFMKIETRRGDGDSRRSYIWTVNPARSHELEQSLSKLMERDRENTLKSLANPDDFDAIRTGTLDFNFKRPIRRKSVVQAGRGEASKQSNRNEKSSCNLDSQSKSGDGNNTQKVHNAHGPRRVLNFGDNAKSELHEGCKSLGISSSINEDKYELPPLPELSRLLNDGDEILQQPPQVPPLFPRYQPPLENPSDFDATMSEFFNSSLKCDNDICNETQCVSAFDLAETNEQLNVDVQGNCQDIVDNSYPSYEFPEPCMEESLQLTPIKWYSDCHLDDPSNIVSPGNDVMLSDAIINKSPERDLRLSSFEQWQYEPVTPSRWTEFTVPCKDPQCKSSRNNLHA